MKSKSYTTIYRITAEPIPVKEFLPKKNHDTLLRILCNLLPDTSRDDFSKNGFKDFWSDTLKYHDIPSDLLERLEKGNLTTDDLIISEDCCNSGFLAHLIINRIDKNDYDAPKIPTKNYIQLIFNNFFNLYNIYNKQANKKIESVLLKEIEPMTPITSLNSQVNLQLTYDQFH